MKATAFLTIATASSLPAPSAAIAAPTKASVAARAEISGFLDQMFTFYLRSIGWAGGSHDRAREAAEMAGDVDDFADEIKPRHGPGLERLRREFRCIDAAQRHFRGAVAFGAIRPDAPLLNRRSDVCEMPVGEVGNPFRASNPVRNGAREPLRKKVSQRGRHF